MKNYLAYPYYIIQKYCTYDQQIQLLLSNYKLLMDYDDSVHLNELKRIEKIVATKIQSEVWKKSA